MLLVPAPTDTVNDLYTTLADRARALRQKATAEDPYKIRRILIALAGPPGSGKSTVAAKVAQCLNDASPNGPYAAVLPMDGFHLTRAELGAMECCTEAKARRGVFWTYDSQGVLDLVRAIYDSRHDLGQVHHAPSFDHATKDPVQDAIEIHQSVRLLIMEGNWLLYDEQPWASIAPMMDDTWFVDVDDDLALHRVVTRHLESGIESNWADALHRATTNDLLNGALVREKLIEPNVRVESVQW